jgi:hypothetical protein
LDVPEGIPEYLEDALPALGQQTEAAGGTGDPSEEVCDPAGVEAVPEEEVLVVRVAEVSQESTSSLELVQDVLKGQL